jgi:hypothetical protein
VPRRELTSTGSSTDPTRKKQPPTPQPQPWKQKPLLTLSPCSYRTSKGGRRTGTSEAGQRRSKRKMKSEAEGKRRKRSWGEKWRGGVTLLVVMGTRRNCLFLLLPPPTLIPHPFLTLNQTLRRVFDLYPLSCTSLSKSSTGSTGPGWSHRRNPWPPSTSTLPPLQTHPSHSQRGRTTFRSRPRARPGTATRASPVSRASA